MQSLVTILELFRSLLTAPIQSCNASIFGMPNDKYQGGTLRCVMRNPRSSDLGIAHRTLPCGTRVIIVNERTHKWSSAVVMDRGPYGAIYHGQWVLKRSNNDPGRWRGGVDLLPAVAKKIGHNGFEKVKLLVPPGE